MGEVSAIFVLRYFVAVCIKSGYLKFLCKSDSKRHSYITQTDYCQFLFFVLQLTVYIVIQRFPAYFVTSNYKDSVLCCYFIFCLCRFCVFLDFSFLDFLVNFVFIPEQVYYPELFAFYFCTFSNLYFCLISGYFSLSTSLMNISYGLAQILKGA